MKTSSIAVETSRSISQSDSIVRQTNKRSFLSDTTMNNIHIFNDKKMVITRFRTQQTVGICGRPRTSSRVQLHGSGYLHGDEVTFSCHGNYDLFGKAKLRCMDRAWDSLAPECKGRISFSLIPLRKRVSF